MTKREKRLGGILLVAALIVGHVWGVGKFLEFRQELVGRQSKARQSIADGEMFATQREQRQDEMDWLADHKPEEKERQNAETSLEELASREASRQGLEIKKRRFLSAEESGAYYHRVRAEYMISGTEASLYRWLDQMQVPDQFRAITSLRLAPQRDDETKVDCTAIVEQWYIPAPPAL